jgi:SAM-dependent methyltransferase
VQKPVEHLEQWKLADAYEPYVGRWSRLVAREFLSWLDASPDLCWLDVGCGTGALSHAILEAASPQKLLAIDRSFDYLRLARARANADCAGYVVADAGELPALRDGVDIAVSGLVLNFVPKPDRMILEMARTVRPGGQIAVYLWDYAERMDLMRYFWDAAVALNPGAAPLDEGLRFPLCRPKPLRDLFEGIGLSEVNVRANDVPTVFRDFEDYWSPFLGGQGPAPGYAASLSESDRSALRERVRGMLPVQEDGSIPLVARAWAVRGRRPH